MDMESIYQSFENTRAKRFIEDVLSAAFPVRHGSNRAACFRPWWYSYSISKHKSLDPFRPFERGEEGTKKSKEGTFETPQQSRSRSLMSLEHRDVHRLADAARRQEAERNFRSLETTRLRSGFDLGGDQTTITTDSTGTSLAD